MSDTIDSLSIRIDSDAQNASGGLERLLNTLNSIKQAVAPATAELDKLRASISALSNIKATINANPVRKALKDITAAVRTVSQDDIMRLNSVGTAMYHMTSSFANTSALDGANLDSFTTSISNLSTVVRSIDDETIDKLRTLGYALNEIQSAGNVRLNLPDMGAADTGASGFLNSLKKNGSKYAGMAFGALGGAMKTAYSGASGVLKGLSSSLTWFTEKINPANGALGSFVKGLGRIAKYRLLRTIIKEITSGASEGLQNLAHASSEANAVLSQLSGAALTLKNSMGGMLYSAIAPNIGILTGLANAAIRAMDALSQLFAILGGRSTYKKATTATQSYADALKGATGRAKAFKQELMGFDEINALSPDNDYGGGSGRGLDDLNYGAMFQEAPVSEWLRSMVQAGNFSALGVMIADKINNALSGIDWKRVKKGARKAASSLTTLLNGFFGEMDPSVWGQTIGELINTATTFIGNFWRDTDWYMIGTRVQGMIVNALKTIDAKQLATAVMGKFRSLVSFLNGLLPDTMADWNVITTRISEFINNAIEQIPTDGIAQVIRSVILGGLSLITNLAENKTLTKLANAIVESLHEAIKDITPEQVSAALKALKDDILGALKAAFSLTIDIGDMKWNAAGLVIGGAALWNAIKGAFTSLFTGTGWMKGAKGLMIMGGIGFAIDAAVRFDDIVEDASNGKALDFQKVVDIGKSAFTSMGFFLSSAGKSKYGGIALGIGAALELVSDVKSVVESAENGSSLDVNKLCEIVSNSFTKLGFTLLATGSFLAGGFSITLGLGIKLVTSIIDTVGDFANAGVVTAVKEIQDAYGDIALTAEQLKIVNDAVAEINSKKPFAPMLTFGVLAAAGDGAVFAEVLKQTGLTIDEVAEKAHLTNEQIEALGLKAKSATPEVNDLAQAASSVTDPLRDMPIAVDEALPSFEKLNGIDTSSSTAAFDDLTSSVKDSAASIKGTGDEAQTASDRIAEIPTSVPLDISIANYDTLISNLDTVNGKMAATGNWIDSLKTKCSVDLPSALSTLQVRIDTSIVSSFTSMQLKIESVINSLSGLQRSINSLHGATLYINVHAGLSSGAKNFLSKLSSVDSSVKRKVNALVSASQFASGGYPESGELFIANENGRQEMVGRIGNRAAVANQDQIGDAIFRYMDEHDRDSGGGPSADEIGSAVANALRRAGIGSVYLEGRDLARAINKESQRAGHPVISF